MAVRVRFELTEPVKVQRFSRPPHSTTLPPHRSKSLDFSALGSMLIHYTAFLPFDATSSTTLPVRSLPAGVMREPARLATIIVRKIKSRQSERVYESFPAFF